MKAFKDAVAIVTGGGAGIGRAISVKLAEYGAKAVFIVDRNSTAAEETAQLISGKGCEAEAHVGDVRDEAFIKEVVDYAVQKHGKINYVFNNAGIGVCGKAEDFTAEHWSDVMDVNFGGVLNGARAAYPVMLKQGFGHIVNTASMAGLTPIPLISSYTTSKFAIVGMSISLRMEAASRGVKVSVICPGVVRTEMLKGRGEGNEVLFKVPQSEVDKAFDVLFPVSPEKFAARTLKKVAANKAIIIEPWWWSVGWWMFRLMPGLTIKLYESYFYEQGLRRVEAAAGDTGDGNDI